MSAPLISVVIPAFGNARLLENSLETLRKQTVRDDCEVIVVDDGSTQPLAVPSWCRLLRLERAPEHRGSSAAKNAGAELATGEYLSFCDSDILHMSEAIASLLAEMRDWESEGMYKVILNTMRVSLPRDYPDKFATDLPRLESKLRIAGALQDEDCRESLLCYEQNESLMRREFFEELGGYDAETFKSWGFNNQDLDLRAIKAGGRITSYIRRCTNGKRLYCFHQFHENHVTRQPANDEFASKWGEPFTRALFFNTLRGVV